MLIVISDIHTKWKKAQQLLDEYDNSFNEFVFLGDFLDDFGDSPEINVETALWVMKKAQDSNKVFLQGNHDISYLRPPSRCSGWTKDKQDALIKCGYVDFAIKTARFFYCPIIGGKQFVISHAGIHPDYIPEAIIDGPDAIIQFLEEEEKYALRCLDTHTGNSWIFNAGRSRGGKHLIGGPLWCHWDEFEPIDEIHQIFGHTKCRYTRELRTPFSQNYCIDTDLNHYLTIDDEGNCAVEPINV
jgi:hypothetical protein